jgi:hypothetical protein
VLQVAGFYKSKGLTAVTLLLETICAIIVAATPNAYIIYGKTYEAEKLSKSPFYRFLSLANVNRRKFHKLVSFSTIPHHIPDMVTALFFRDVSKDSALNVVTPEFAPYNV